MFVCSLIDKTALYLQKIVAVLNGNMKKDKPQVFERGQVHQVNYNRMLDILN